MIYKGLLQDYICQINFFSFDNYYVINENVDIKFSVHNTFLE
jgi:hypothetical protein